MVKWIASILLYLITIIAGFYIDKASYKKTRSTARKLYVVWLFIFLCFGYMVGADWPHYEQAYDNFDVFSFRFLREPGSWLVFRFMPDIISDFWIFTALFKSLYLASVIFLLSKITERWLSVIAIAIPIVLGQMLIQNPFRFMMSQIFVIIAAALIYGYLIGERNPKNLVRWLSIGLLLIIAVLFHNTSVIYIVLFPFLLLSNKISKTPSVVLFVLYFAIAVFSSNASFITDLISKALGSLSIIEMKDYASSYNPEDNAAFFTIGSLAQMLFFLIILLSRKTIQRDTQNGNIIFAITVIYFLFARLIIIIPSGQRLPFPLSFFYAVYIIEMLRNKRCRSMGLVVALYIMLAFTKKLWTVYDMIPYSNSIPYIITGHKPFDERYQYNPRECYERTGEWPEILDEDF